MATFFRICYGCYTLPFSLALSLTQTDTHTHTHTHIHTHSGRLVKLGNSSRRCALLCAAGRASIMYAPHTPSLYMGQCHTHTRANTHTHTHTHTHRRTNATRDTCTHTQSGPQTPKALVKCQESCRKGLNPVSLSLSLSLSLSENTHKHTHGHKDTLLSDIVFPSEPRHLLLLLHFMSDGEI